MKKNLIFYFFIILYRIPQKSICSGLYKWRISGEFIDLSSFLSRNAKNLTHRYGEKRCLLHIIITLAR